MSSMSRYRSIISLLAALSILGCGALLYIRLRAPRTRQTTEISPGISITAVSTQTPGGPLRYWLVKAEKSAAQLGLEVADARDVKKRRNVRELAAQSGATVAINGGFFAYGGAAVGAVKVGGKWHRLPWKSRSALLWNEKGAQIAALSGQCSLHATSRGNSALQAAPEVLSVEQASLNGWMLPGTHEATKDGFAVFTPNFGARVPIGAQESGFLVRRNHITARDLSGEVEIPQDGYLLVARTSQIPPAAPFPAATIGTRLQFTTTTQPAELNEFPDILGAGPLLVQDGAVKTTEVAEEFRPDVIARGPRTAVGWDAEGNWLFLVADGRQSASMGLTLPETAQLFQELGAVQALNLDGGSSTQLVVKGELINKPSGYDPVNPLRPLEVPVTNALVLKPR